MPDDARLLLASVGVFAGGSVFLLIALRYLISPLPVECDLLPVPNPGQADDLTPDVWLSYIVTYDGYSSRDGGWTWTRFEIPRVETVMRPPPTSGWRDGDLADDPLDRVDWGLLERARRRGAAQVQVTLRFLEPPDGVHPEWN